jgi:Flp pilus assembly protein TadG
MRILRRRNRSLLRSTSGQSLVELAVAGPFMVFLLLGILEFGQIVYYSIEVTNAAKAGASYGELTSADAYDQNGIKLAALAAAPDLSSSNLSVTSSRSCICSDGSASTCSLGDCPTSHIETMVTVNTSATISPIITLPGFNSFTLSGQAIQQCLQ